MCEEMLKSSAALLTTAHFGLKEVENDGARELYKHFISFPSVAFVLLQKMVDEANLNKEAQSIEQMITSFYN